LFKRYAGEPLDELMDGRVVFQVFEERSHRHSGAAKNPSATYASGVAINGSACGPVNHQKDASTRAFCDG
jgi:hypothetical protein